MKKSLIAMAVLAASGASFAQSSVTLYGLLDVAAGSTKTNGVTTTFINSGGINTSRWGLKGSEDLGGGLKANFKLEQGFDVSNGAPQSTNGLFGPSTTASFSRYAYVGFSGGFGEVKLGKTGTAYDDISGNGDGMFDANVSVMQTIMPSAFYTWTPSNGIYYASPVMGGFSGAFSYNLGENKTATQNAGEVASVNAQYNGGPIYVGLAYQTEKAGGTISQTKTDYTRLNGSYDFGVAKLGLVFGHVAYNTAGVSNVNDGQIGVDVPLGSNVVVSGSYAYAKPSNGNKTTGWGLAANYTLSKRTFVYVALEADKKDNTPAADHNLFAVGVQHKF